MEGVADAETVTLTVGEIELVIETVTDVLPVSVGVDVLDFETVGVVVGVRVGVSVTEGVAEMVTDIVGEMDEDEVAVVVAVAVVVDVIDGVTDSVGVVDELNDGEAVLEGVTPRDKEAVGVMDAVGLEVTEMEEVEVTDVVGVEVTDAVEVELADAPAVAVVVGTAEAVEVGDTEMVEVGVTRTGDDDEDGVGKIHVKLWPELRLPLDCETPETHENEDAAQPRPVLWREVPTAVLRFSSTGITVDVSPLALPLVAVMARPRLSQEMKSITDFRKVRAIPPRALRILRKLKTVKDHPSLTSGERPERRDLL